MADASGPPNHRLDRDPKRVPPPPRWAAAAEPPSPDARTEPPPDTDRGGAAMLFDALARAPHDFDFFQAMRRLECSHRERPRLGKAVRLADEAIRLGQEPSLAFAPSALARLAPSKDSPPWLLVHFFGLLGPNGPLPLHMTEYVRDRIRNADDPTMARFFDLFHHRMLLLLYRAWANGEPTVEHDRPEDDRFAMYTAALAGLAMPSLRNRDEFPDSAKLYYVGRLAAHTRNAEGLRAMIGDFFEMPASIEEFVGTWLELPVENRWALGRAPRGILGASSVLGAHVWGSQQKFRVVLGPLSQSQFRRMLPGAKDLAKLRALVRNYVGDDLCWDLKLILAKHTEERMTLGTSRVGWTSWLGKSAGGWREDLILDPDASVAQAA